MRSFRIIYLLSCIVVMILTFWYIDKYNIEERIAIIGSLCSLFAFGYLLFEVLNTKSETKKINEAVSSITKKFKTQNAQNAFTDLCQINSEILRLLKGKSYTSLESKFEEWKALHAEIVENPVLKEQKAYKNLKSKGCEIISRLGDIKGLENVDDLKRLERLIFYFSSYEATTLSLKNKLLHDH